MIDELKDTKLIKKFGGRFKLTTLIQKRLVELAHGARPLIKETEGKTQMEIVVEEIVNNKITLEKPADSNDKTDE